MPSLHIEFYSDVLRIDTGIEVIYPQNCTRTPEPLRDVIKPPFPVLYLVTRQAGSVSPMWNNTSWIWASSSSCLRRAVAIISTSPMDTGTLITLPRNCRRSSAICSKYRRNGKIHSLPACPWVDMVHSMQQPSARTSMPQQPVCLVS